MNHRDRFLLYAALVTTLSCLAYLVYAAIRGWVGLDVLTLVVTLSNTVLLFVLFYKLDRSGRDD
jgi:hypothetical protein